MCRKMVFITYKNNINIDRDFTLLSNSHQHLIKLLSENMNIKIIIEEEYLFNYYFIVRFESKILKKEVSCKISFNTLSGLENKLHIDPVLIILENLLRSIDIMVIEQKRFGIIPITELPYKFYTKILNNYV